MTTASTKPGEICIEAATREHFSQFYEKAPQQTVRAIVAVRDGKVLGVAGVYPRGAGLVMFAELTDDLKKEKRAIVRGMRRLMGFDQIVKSPVHAIADPEIPGSEILLEHMGFARNHGSLYTWQC